MITIIKQEHWQSAIGYVYNNYYIVYSTKYRREVLTGEIAEAMKEINMKLAEDNGFIL
ncbi:MAG: transposase, partial [Thermoplasmata archaeon]